MNNIWTIFKNDLKHLGANAISWVVVVGLVVIPSLYAWFCIYAFWDPYNNTEHLKVAVASMDEGYKSSLIPIQINMGKEIQEQMRENRKLDWVFLDRKEAIEGVKSGKYYAALVFPKDFSRSLLSILDDDVRSAEILYYINEKENAIAAKVSGQGASTIQNTIDEAVAATASEILLNSIETVSNFLSDEDTEAVAEHLLQRLRDFSDELDSSAVTLDNLCSINITLNNLMKATDDLLTEIGENTSASLQELETMDQSFDSLEEELNAISGKVDDALLNTQRAYQSVDTAASRYLQDMNTDAVTVSQSLNTFADRVQTIINRFEDLQSNIQDLANSLPEELSVSRALLNEMTVSLDRSIRQQIKIHDSLVDASSDLTGVSSDALWYQGELSGYISRCGQDMQTMRDRFQGDVQPQILTLSDSLSQTKQSVRNVTAGLGDTASDMKNVTDTVSGDMDQMNQNLTSTGALLRDAAGKIRDILNHMEETDESGAREVLKQLMNNDPETVGSYVSSIVQLDNHIIYPVANFGTAMTPFYTSLAIWVGAVILVAMMSVTVSGKMQARLTKVKNWQLYLGRFGVFLLISLLQTLLIAAGDLFFLGVKCAHPVHFVLACLYIGIVFVTLIYTLTVSFGNIGKAIAVILLVFQVAGSGGTIPIEMTPPFFHIFYPLLPLTHSMTALRECVAGMYGNNYYTELGILSIYILISLVLGLVLRNPMISMNQKFIEKVESTKVM